MPNKSKLFLYFIKPFLLLLVVALFLVSCKATSTLNLSMDSSHDGSGKINLKIKLDQEALDTLRSAAYKPIELSQVFNSGELSKAGFAVDINGGDINISRKFGSEIELQSALDALAGKGVVQAVLKSNKSLTSIKNDVELKVGLGKIRDMFLKDDSIKQTLKGASIDFSSYETLINKAFDATTLSVSIKDGKTTSATKSLSDKKTSELKVASSSTKLRTVFLLGNIGAILCLLVLVFVLIRKWHTPRLISKGE